MCCLHQTTNAVATHFGNTAVGVVETHGEVGSFTNSQQQQTICTNASGAIAPLPRKVGPCSLGLTLGEVVDQEVVL